MPIPVVPISTELRVESNQEQSHERFVDGLFRLPAVLDWVAGSCLQWYIEGLSCIVPVIAVRFRSR